jgi:hypothetical protein
MPAGLRTGYSCNRVTTAINAKSRGNRLVRKWNAFQIAIRRSPTMQYLPDCADIDVAPEFLCLSFNACGARARQLKETIAALAVEDNQ